MRIRNSKTGQSYFSKRRRAFLADLAPHELTFSCYRQYRFLSKDRTRDWFIEAVDLARNKWPIDLWAWAIMPEHIHLILAPRESNISIGRIRGFIKEHVARKAIVWLERNSPEWIPRITVKEGARLRRRFWQPGGGYDRTIDTISTLYSMLEYIHQNPVRRGLVTHPLDWEWSSARWYVGQPARLQLDATLPVQHDS